MRRRIDVHRRQGTSCPRAATQHFYSGCALGRCGAARGRAPQCPRRGESRTATPRANCAKTPAREAPPTAQHRAPSTGSSGAGSSRSEREVLRTEFKCRYVREYRERCETYSDAWREAQEVSAGLGARHRQKDARTYTEKVRSPAPRALTHVACTRPSTMRTSRRQHQRAPKTELLRMNLCTVVPGPGIANMLHDDHMASFRKTWRLERHTQGDNQQHTARGPASERRSR